MKDGNKIVSGGELALYKVAGVENSRYVYTRQFQNAGVDVNDGRSISSAATAKTLSGMITADTALEQSVNIGTDGQGTASGLSDGLYLITQTKASPGYEKITPFLVTIPENGSYSVDATPKMSVLTQETPGKVTPAPGKNTPGKTTTSTTPATPLRLPQTGQLWWPVWILTAMGVVLIVAGEAWKHSAGRRY